MMTSLG